MWRYALRRLFWGVPTFLFITLVTFFIVHLGPGDPAFVSAGASTGSTELAAEARARLRSQWGLDGPLVERYVRWVGRCVRLDFGRSFHDGQSVRAKLGERFARTALLALAALVVALLIAIPVGAQAAAHAGGWFDRGVGLLCFGLFAIPRYVMGMLLIVVVGVQLRWLPFMGMGSPDAGEMPGIERWVDVARHSLLIGACLCYPLAAYLSRFVRDNVAAVLSEDYIRTARAKGASRMRVLYVHALPNALLPLLTVIGLALPGLLSGAVILEVMFSWPGMGRLMFDAVMQRDYPVILGASALAAVVVLLGTLAVDLLYAAADPRVRYT